MISFIKEALRNQYGLTADEIKEAPGGWSASAFVVHTDKGRYFVKGYDKSRPSVQQWIKRMALYMPVMLWLSGNTPLGKNMIAPVLTKNRGYQAENQWFVLLVFPFVEGSTLGDAQLTSAQVRQLADALALLHSFDEQSIPVPTQPLRETYALPFLDDLAGVMHTTNIPSGLQTILQEHSRSILESVDTLRQLAEHMRGHPPRYALCHTDLHGWNLMWDGRLILIDWEGLRLAPVEADLFAFSDGFFFDDAREAFFSAYQKANPAYTANQTAMDYYRLRRRLEDIAEFSLSTASDTLTDEEVKCSLSYLKKECAALEHMQIKYEKRGRN